MTALINSRLNLGGDERARRRGSCLCCALIERTAHLLSHARRSLHARLLFSNMMVDFSLAAAGLLMQSRAMATYRRSGADQTRKGAFH